MVLISTEKKIKKRGKLMNVTNTGAKTAASMLKLARIRKGMTGASAAKACGLSGSQYSRMENGKVGHWSDSAIRGASVILDITIDELKETLNEAPPPMWMKRQEEINDNAIHKLEEETVEIIAALVETSKDSMKHSQARTDQVIEYIETKGAERFRNQQAQFEEKICALSAELKESQNQAIEKMSKFAERIEKAVLQGVNAADKRNRQITEMVSDEIDTFRKAASYIATDMELELANLKRIVSEVRDVVQENSKHGSALVQKLPD